MASSLRALHDLPAIWQRARAQAPLSPGERAALKFTRSALIFAVPAALLVLGQIVLGHGTLTLPEAGLVLLLIFLGALTNAAAKFASAQGDSQVGAALALLADEGIAAACAASGLSPQMAAAIAGAIRGQFAVASAPAPAPTPVTATPTATPAATPAADAADAAAADPRAIAEQATALQRPIRLASIPSGAKSAHTGQ